MSYATTNHLQASLARPNGGRRGPAYEAAKALVRTRAQYGEPCHFYRQPGYADCPGRIDLNLHHNHPLALTKHHLDRLMDGGQPVADQDRVAPAHRRCNSRDGLRAQNARRQARRGVSLPPGQGGMPAATLPGGYAAARRAHHHAEYAERVSDSW